MSYYSLARKLRPSRFDELVGQENTAQILRNAVLSNRVAHAFLFAGSRGVGKTSAARILTRAINCLNLDRGDPCNTCENCIEINKNASPDIYEIDAASNRGIDNIRELRENINYVPARCPYKVYIIDEAHMLTLESFNALLKTLEEPPKYAKFILATTDPHKIPQTIISRCQRYDFLRISIKKISDYLEKIVKHEKLNISRKALEMIASNSVGGMRDALTAIDQILSFNGNTVSDKEVSQILGILDNESRFALVEALLNKKDVDSIKHLHQLREHGYDANDILSDLLHTIKTISLVRTLGTESTLFQDMTTDDLEVYNSLAEVASLDELQQIFNILLQLEDQLKQSAHEIICFEMAILKITSTESLVGLNELIDEIKSIRKEVYTKNELTKNDSRESIIDLEKVKSSEKPVNQSPYHNGNKNRFDATNLIEKKSKLLVNDYEEIKSENVEKINTTNEIPVKNEENKSKKDLKFSNKALNLSTNELFFEEREKNANQALERSKNLNEIEINGLVSNSLETDLGNISDGKKPIDMSEKPPQEWIEFSKNVQKRSPKLASIIRNAIPQQFGGHQLDLIFKSGSFSSLLNENDMNLLGEIAREFSGRDIYINCSDFQPKSPKQTIAQFEEINLEKEKELKREKASQTKQVKGVLSVFYNSKIDNIKLSDE